MENSSIVLISKNTEDMRFAEAVALSLGMKVLQFATSEGAYETATSLQKPLLFADVSSEEDYKDFCLYFAPEIALGISKFPCSNTHFIVAPHSPTTRSLATGVSMFTHLILRNYGDPRKAGLRYGNALRNAASFATEKNCTYTLKLQNSGQKNAVLDKILHILTNHADFPQHVAANIRNAADELLMNAFFARNSSLTLRPGSEVDVEVSFGLDYAAVSVVDHFGSLDQKNVLRSLLARPPGLPLRTDPKSENSGLGLALTFQRGGSLVIETKSGVRSKVTALYHRQETYRDFKSQFRFVSVNTQTA